MQLSVRLDAFSLCLCLMLSGQSYFGHCRESESSCVPSFWVPVRVHTGIKAVEHPIPLCQDTTRSCVRIVRILLNTSIRLPCMHDLTSVAALKMDKWVQMSTCCTCKRDLLDLHLDLRCALNAQLEVAAIAQRNLCVALVREL